MRQFRQNLDCVPWRFHDCDAVGVSGALRRCSLFRLDGRWWIRERPESLPDGTCNESSILPLHPRQVEIRHPACQQARLVRRSCSGASDGKCTLCQSCLWQAYQLPELLLYLVQGTWQHLSTWLTHLPAGGDPVRAAGLSWLFCLGQRHLPVREFRTRRLLPGLSHAAHCQCVRSVGSVCDTARLERDSLGICASRTTGYSQAG